MTIQAKALARLDVKRQLLLTLDRLKGNNHPNTLAPMEAKKAVVRRKNACHQCAEAANSLRYPHMMPLLATFEVLTLDENMKIDEASFHLLLASPAMSIMLYWCLGLALIALVLVWDQNAIVEIERWGGDGCAGKGGGGGGGAC